MIRSLAPVAAQVCGLDVVRRVSTTTGERHLMVDARAQRIREAKLGIYGAEAELASPFVTSKDLQATDNTISSAAQPSTTSLLPVTGTSAGLLGVTRLVTLTLRSNLVGIALTPALLGRSNHIRSTEAIITGLGSDPLPIPPAPSVPGLALAHPPEIGYALFESEAAA